MLLASSVAVTHRALATVDLVIIGVYFAIVFGIGMYFARKERTSEDYFLAGRDVGWFFIGASLFVSNISTEHFIGLSGTGASSGLAVGHFEWLACLILLILGWVFVPFYLRSGKRMSADVTEVAIRFRSAPTRLFHDSGIDVPDYNGLVFRIRPAESINLFVQARQPGLESQESRRGTASLVRQRSALRLSHPTTGRNCG